MVFVFWLLEAVAGPRAVEDNGTVDRDRGREGAATDEEGSAVRSLSSPSV